MELPSMDWDDSESGSDDGLPVFAARVGKTAAAAEVPSSPTNHASLVETSKDDDAAVVNADEALAASMSYAVSGEDQDDEDSDDGELLFFNQEEATDGPDAATRRAADEAQQMAELTLQSLSLSESVLRDLTGESNLAKVETMQLQINSETQGVSDLGRLVPNLKELRLDNSYVTSFRDLGGRHLGNIEMLWLGQCGLSDLDGVENLTKLKELHVPLNSVSELDSLMSHQQLVVLDLFANKIRDINCLDFLGNIQSLAFLKLAGNPISSRKYYRNIVCSRIPHLKVLDDITVTEEERVQLSEMKEALVDSKALAEVQDQSEVDLTPSVLSIDTFNAEAEMIKNGQNRPLTGTPRSRNSTLNNALEGYYSRPVSTASNASGGLSSRGSDLGDSPLPWSRPNSQGWGDNFTENNSTFGWRPMTSSSTPRERPSTASWLPRKASEDSIAAEAAAETARKEDSSRLTLGGDSLSGNFVSAMRQRRRDKKIAAAREEAASREAKVQQQPVPTATTTATTTSTENTFTKTGLKEYMQQMEPQDKKQQQIKSPVVRPQPTPPRKKPNRAQSSPHAQRKYHAAPVSPRQQARPREDTAHDNKAHLARKIRKQVLKEGYLLKQSPQGNWNKRYFMLLPHVILYCKRASDVAEGGKIARIIIHSDQDHQGTLHTPVVLTPDQKDNIASKYWNSLFAISPPARDHERPKLHVMAAKNEAVHAEWVQLIQEVLDRE